MAQTHFREGLKFDPEHKGCKDGHKQVGGRMGLWVGGKGLCVRHGRSMLTSITGPNHPPN